MRQARSRARVISVRLRVCVSFEPFVLRQQPTPFSRLYLSTRLCPCLWLPSRYTMCLPCAESTSRETLQFTYHIQTAFVLDICHFHSLVSHSPLLHTLLYVVPESAATKSGLIFVHFDQWLAVAEWRPPPRHQKQMFKRSKQPFVVVVFLWWVTSCGHESNYGSVMYL